MDLRRYSEGGAELAVFHLIDKSDEYSLDIVNTWRGNATIEVIGNGTEYQLAGMSVSL